MSTSGNLGNMPPAVVAMSDLTAEQTARQNADTSETTARQNADTAEQTARTNADALLQPIATLEATVAGKIGTGGTLDTALDGRIHAQAGYRNVTKYLQKDFGAKGDGTTDDTAALVAALAPAKGATPNSWPSGTYVDLVIEPGVYKVSPNQIIWDYARCRVTSIGAALKVMTTASTDVGITIQTTAPDSSGVHAKSIESTGLMLLCGNASRVGTAFSIAGVTTGTPGDMTTSYRLAASITMHGLVALGFDKGLLIGSNTFMDTFDSCAFSSCNQGVVYPNGLSNSGERLRFTNCNFTDQVGGTRGVGGTNPQIYNTTLPYISMGADQTLQFDNCSFDWIAQLFSVATNGILHFDQCHLETPSNLALATTAEIVDATRAYGVVYDHARVFLTHCRILMSAGDPPNIIPYLFDINGWGNVTIRDSTAYFNPGISSGVFPTSMGAIQAWANRPNIVLDGLIYLKNQPEQMPHRCIPGDGASMVEHSYSLSSLDAGISFGSTANGTGTLVNTDLPPNAAALGITNAMKFIAVNQTMSVTKTPGYTPRYVSFDFWAKATGTATGLYLKIAITRGGQDVASFAPAAVPLTTTWTRYRAILDARHSSGGSGRFDASSCSWYFLGVPGGDNSALIAGMVMDAWS